MLDLHVHVLPGIDDGPRTMEDALALARALADDGIEHLVATPHIYLGVFDNSAARIGEAFDAFQTAVSDAGIDLTMTWAAEVRICPEILDWIESRRLPMLNGSLVGPSTALIELPDGQIPVGTDKLMGMMLDRGITPLMAHPERNKAVMEQPTRLDALRRLGCKFQVTAGSLLGDFGSRAQATAQKLLDAGWVDVVATDAHNRSSRRPRLGAARDWLTEHFDAALALRLTRTQPAEIAGVSSFAIQSGGQRLVFRDLPAMPPLEASDLWSVEAMLGAATASAPAAATATAPGQNDAAQAWSLVDFRIDAVVDGLSKVSLLHETPDLDHRHAPPTQAPAEDWQLPVFGQTPPAPLAAAPAVVAAPPTAEPECSPASRGLRLNEVSQRPSVSSPIEMARIRPVPPRPVPLAQVEPAPDQPTAATPDGKRQGFRLSDLNPLPNRRR